MTFSMIGSSEERFQSFSDNCWKSHGIFYSLIRTKSLRACPEIGLRYFGSDWSIILFLAACGKVARVDKGLAVFGTNGVSNQRNVWASFRSRPIHWVMPLYEFSVYTYRLTSGFSWHSKVGFVARLFKLNIVSALFQVCAEAREMVVLVKDRLGAAVARMDFFRWIK